MLNQKKATLDAKADISASTRRLSLLEKELAELKEKVRTTQRLIQEEKASIVMGDDKDDEAAIARADAIRAEAIHAIEGFLN